MCDVCDGQSFTEVLQGFRSGIARYGWAAQYVEGDLEYTAIGYSVGLTEHGHPEVLVAGRCADETWSLLDDIAFMVVSHKHFLEAGMILDLPDRRVCLLPIERPGDLMDTAEALYGDELRAFQAVWADDGGRFPWQQSPPDTLTQPIYGNPTGL